MLVSPDSGTVVTKIPHVASFRAWRKRLTDAQYEAIADELDRRIDGDEVHTSSWMPGSDWTDTVFHPIYEDACHRDQSAAARFFGLILWDVMMRRPETWAFGRYEMNGTSIEGLTYFRVDSPAASA